MTFENLLSGYQKQYLEWFLTAKRQEPKTNDLLKKLIKDGQYSVLTTR